MSRRSVLAFGLLATSVFVSPVIAADLPSKKAKGVDYVKVCSTYGEGFFTVPGSNSCMKVGGQVRFEGYYNQPFLRSDHTTSTAVRARLDVDHRTATEYGLLRTYLAYHLTKASGGGLASNFVELDKAFVQFGGLTAGRVNSFFDFYNNELNFIDVRGSDSKAVNLLAYTHAFSKDVTATLSVEDGTHRRTVFTGITNAGHSVPDVVANLRLEQAWGAFQVSAATHQLRNATAAVDTKYGFAVQAGLKYNVPMGAGDPDLFFLQAAYADGAINYLGYPFGSFLAAKGVGVDIGDYDVVGGKIKTTKGYSLVAAYKHNWSDAWSSSLMGSFSDIRESVVVGDKFRELNVGMNVVWSPVKNFLIGPEVFYRHADTKNNGAGGFWSGALRIERTF